MSDTNPVVLHGPNQCPTCGAWRDGERTISPPGGFVECSDDWHKVEEQAATIRTRRASQKGEHE